MDHHSVRYDINNIQIIDDQRDMDVYGSLDNWKALESAITPNTKYEFVSEQPLEYFDFKDRYLVRRVDSEGSKGVLSREESHDFSNPGGLQNDDSIMLAYCFVVTVSDGYEPVPGALVEDIIADVELMKG